MADRATGRTDPFADVISLVAGPIAAVVRSFDQLRRGAEDLRGGLENFNSTMSNLNETAERVNRLLADLEEPVRAMLPQITRTIEAAEAMSKRLSGPIDQVIPGITRLADTLNAPVLTTFPTDLGQFMTIINDLSRRLSPLGQIAEQAGSMFGLRLPIMPSRQPVQPEASEPEPAPRSTARRTSSPAKSPAKKPAKKATTRKRTAKKSSAP